MLVPMRRFLGSLWFSLLLCLVMGGVAVLAYWKIVPDAGYIGNSEMVRVFTVIGWGVGPVIGLLSFILIGIINLVRRIFRLRRIGFMHPVANLLCISPWLVTSWVLLDEPPYTAFARAVMEYVARPMLWGSFVAALCAIVFSLPVLFPQKK